MKIEVGVREIAYFLYASGDLSQDFFSNTSAIEGTKCHQFLQRKYNEQSQKEFFIKNNVKINDDEIELTGRIDGVLNENSEIIIEEIKSTRLNLDFIDLNYHNEHLAQLKLYGYMYMDLYELTSIKLRLTYINISSYKTKTFDLLFSYDELKDFFYESIIKYIEWINIVEEKKKDRIDTLKEIKFPFDSIRMGQRDMMKASYYTLSHNQILYTIAPTGIGKTMASIFSGLKALKNEREKLFYLTGKSTGKKVAEESLKLLIDKGLKIKGITITAKAKSCLNDCLVCDPLKCEYAKGYFNRLREALEYAYNAYNMYTPSIIFEVAKTYKICPFEFSLDLSELCDVIICDYNYIFDPKAHLIRYFDDSMYKPKLLIDEAHNLVSRARDMYSKTLSFKRINTLLDIMPKLNNIIYDDIEELDKIFVKYHKLMVEGQYYNKYFDNNIYDVLLNIRQKLEMILSEDNVLRRDEISLIYYEILDFLNIADIYSEAHRFILEEAKDDIILQIVCLDAREYTYDTIKNKANGCHLFSATMTPINYYMELITKNEGKHMQLKSPFDPKNLDVIIDDKISTKYKDRERTIYDVIDLTKTLLNTKKGNYIIFFPSYQYMEMFLNNFDISEYSIIIQNKDLKEENRLQIFEEFKNTKINHLGAFVLGGAFSEGLDFVGDLLKGVIIVGVGVPKICLVNNLEKEYFDDLFGKGYDFSYTYPGFSKVIQAAGRVIRSESDKGIVLLIDERYSFNTYKNLMPEHWIQKTKVNNSLELKNEIKKFYKEDSNEL